MAIIRNRFGPTNSEPEDMDELMNRITVLVRTIDILDGLNPTRETECHEVWTAVNRIKEVHSERQKQLEKAKAQLEEQKIILKKIQMTHQYLDYIEENVPDQVKNKNIKYTEVNNAENRKNNVLGSIPLSENHFNDRNKVAVSEGNLLKASIQKSPSMSLCSVKDEGKDLTQFTTPKPRRDLEIAISHVSNVELNAIPSYMRGRITLDHINAFIDLFNSVLSQKYVILRKPKNSYKVKKDLDQYVEWRSQETDELKRQYFCTAKDLASLGGKKMGTRESNIIIILRHIKRIREVRIKKLVFYVACFYGHPISKGLAEDTGPLEAFGVTRAFWHPERRPAEDYLGKRGQQHT
ncbi:hypothetical protein AAG570_000983 [Ranatra chinensis]|uniref:SKA complex subunit 1 n=1 Tax=Ranatra chinensis TaxID=642074 RepID=A0ABD0YCF1_9HEMI